MAREVKRFGDGFVCREIDSTDDWEAVEIDDIEDDEMAVITDHEARLERIRLHGFDPDQPPKDFVKMIPAGDPENTAANGD